MTEETKDLLKKLKKTFVSRGFNEIPQLDKELSSGYCKLEKGRMTFTIYISKDSKTSKIVIEAYVNANKVLGNRQLGKPLNVTWTGSSENRRILTYKSYDFRKREGVDEVLKSLNYVEENIRQNKITFEEI